MLPHKAGFKLFSNVNFIKFFIIFSTKPHLARFLVAVSGNFLLRLLVVIQNLYFFKLKIKKNLHQPKGHTMRSSQAAEPFVCCRPKQRRSAGENYLSLWNYYHCVRFETRFSNNAPI